MSAQAVPSPIDPGEGTAARTRTHTWSDPWPPRGTGAGGSGLEHLSAIARGELAPPPIAETLGLELVEVARGRVVFALPAHEFLFNPIGSVHGGALATLIDSAASCAVHSVLDAGVAYATTQPPRDLLRAFGAGAAARRARASCCTRAGAWPRRPPGCTTTRAACWPTAP